MPLRLGPDLAQYDERLLKASAYAVELGLVTPESRETRVGGRGHLHALLGGLTSGKGTRYRRASATSKRLSPLDGSAGTYANRRIVGELRQEIREPPVIELRELLKLNGVNPSFSEFHFGNERLRATQRFGDGNLS